MIAQCRHESSPEGMKLRPDFLTVTRLISTCSGVTSKDPPSVRTSPLPPAAKAASSASTPFSSSASRAAVTGLASFLNAAPRVFLFGTACA